jgi:hypothetical protein
LIACGRKEEVQSISSDQALAIAQKTPEVIALYALNNSALAQCLENKVVRPCDSEGWVTCIDNAWVVKYQLNDSCPVKSDGRLSATFLIEGASGKILSKYPEIEYFNDPQFCRDNPDCLCGASDDPASTNGTCLNFIHKPFSKDGISYCGKCVCRNSRCEAS